MEECIYAGRDIEMNKSYKLYKHTSPNNKVYIGITIQDDVNKRWANGKGYQYNEYFTNAIKKYGWDNFVHEILFDNLTEEEAKLMEQMYIALYDSTNRSKGYNMTLGGDGMVGYKHTEKFKQQQSEKMKGNSNAKGERSEETRKKISESKKGENNFCYGKHHSDETKRKMSRARLGSVKIRCIETGEVFNSLREAGKSVGVAHSSISSAIKCGTKSGGYHWEFINEEDVA